MHGIQLKLDWIPAPLYKSLTSSGMKTFCPFYWFYLVLLMQLKYDIGEKWWNSQKTISFPRNAYAGCIAKEKLTYVNILYMCDYKSRLAVIFIISRIIPSMWKCWPVQKGKRNIAFVSGKTKLLLITPFDVWLVCFEMLHIATLMVRLQEQFLKILNRKWSSIQVYKDVYIFQNPTSLIIFELVACKGVEPDLEFHSYMQHFKSWWMCYRSVYLATTTQILRKIMYKLFNCPSFGQATW